MRLWSVHPKYLDSKGLVALWREGLLAKAVLSGKTKGYKNHPQLIRFRKSKNPERAINYFLYRVYLESCKREYCFDRKKIRVSRSGKIPVTRGQIKYEFKHLLKKLKKRDRKRYVSACKIKKIQINPLFKAIPGKTEAWERVS